MATKDRLEQVKAHIDRLKRESVGVVSNANRIVLDGIQKLAEQELKALNAYYKSVVASLKGAKRGDSIKDLAAQQLDLMQETVDRVISAARESMSIIAETRAELARLVQQGGDTSTSALSRIAEPAQRAMTDVKKAAAKAQVTATKAASGIGKAVKKEVAAAEKKGKAVLKEGQAALSEGEAKAREVVAVLQKKVESVLDVAATTPVAVKKAVTAKPSPQSRANRATSKAKKTTPTPDSVKAPAAPPRKR